MYASRGELQHPLQILVESTSVCFARMVFPQDYHSVDNTDFLCTFLLTNSCNAFTSSRKGNRAIELPELLLFYCLIISWACILLKLIPLPWKLSCFQVMLQSSKYFSFQRQSLVFTITLSYVSCSDSTASVYVFSLDNITPWICCYVNWYPAAAVAWTLGNSVYSLGNLILLSVVHASLGLV